MSLVVDASMCLSWCFEDENNAESDYVLARVVSAGAVVPAHWHLEIANGLQSAIRRRRIDRDYRDKTLKDLMDLGIETDLKTPQSAWGRTLQLSDKHGLTVYDAAYLELSIRLSLPLASFDRSLVSSARLEGLHVVGGN
jgi:predicted nucleic acid-binding protein